MADDLALLRAHAPVVRYTEGELFPPASVRTYVARCGLWIHEPGTPQEAAERLTAPGGLTLESLAAAGREHAGRPLELRFVEQPLRGAAMRAWRREDRPRLRGTARLAAVGVLARTVDSLLRLSLLLRGRTPGGTAAAAEIAAREHRDGERCACYGRVARDGGWIILQYWLFHVFNDWRSTFSGVNDHEADWELVTVYLGTDDAGEPVPRWVAASHHDDAGDELRRHWDDPRLSRVGDHPVVFAGAGSHAGTFVAGDLVVSIALPPVRRAVEGAARAWRRLFPWSRWSPPEGAFGLPFVDYARGDGLAVGAGGEREWDICLIGDATPWVRDFRGLWGLDTRDVLGGERAPAGPRYQRDGTVRAAWADPLGWAGLHAEAPSDTAAAADLGARVDALAARAAELDAAVAQRQVALRGAAAELRSLGAGPRAQARRIALRRAERELAELYAERVRVADELAEHRAFLVAPPAPAARPVAAGTAAPPHSRPRMLLVWSVVSTPLLALSGVVLLVGPPLAFLTSLTLFVVLFLGVEAAARGRLLSFLVGLAAAVATVVVAGVLVTALLQNWRLALAALLGLAALVLLVVNVRELRR